MLSQKLQNSITLLLISNHFTGSKLLNAYNTKFFHQIKNHFSTTNLPPFLIFSPYNPLVLPAHLQLSLSNALQIPLGSKFLTDLSTFKHLQSCTLECSTTPSSLSFSFFSISFSSLTIFFLNSTSSWKLTFFFIPILLSLSSLYWTDPLELWFGLFVIHYSFHILHPRSVHLLNSF